MKVLATELSPTLCDPHGLWPSSLLHPGDFPGKNTRVGCHFLLEVVFPIQGPNPGLLHCRQILHHLSHQGSQVKGKVAQLRPTLCDHMDYTVHGILQDRKLEWVAFLLSRGSSQPRDQTQVSHIAGGFFTSRTTREAQALDWKGEKLSGSLAVPFSLSLWLSLG